MKVAIPIRNGRISPVFDVATRLVVVEFTGSEPVERSEFSIVESGAEARASLLQELGITTLICGAISNSAARIVARCGVKLVPWVVGEIDDVLEAFSTDSLDTDGFLMPGCRRGEGSGRRGMTGKGQGRGLACRGGSRRGSGKMTGGKTGQESRRGSGGRRNRE
jgi:predicted Fe-Mo cluster-binding NifX family protein